MTDSPVGREPDPNMNLEGLLSDSGLGGLQDILEQARTSLAGATLEGVAGGGAVRISMSGERKIVAVSIDPEVFASGDAAMLEELILAAAGDAYARGDAQRAASLGSVLQQLTGEDQG